MGVEYLDEMYKSQKLLEAAEKTYRANKVPYGMVKLFKNDGSSRKCISEVRFSGVGALNCESAMFIDGIINFNSGCDVVAKG